MDERFNQRNFAAEDQAILERAMLDLQRVLSDRIRATGNFHAAAAQLVAELRILGHDLWSLDESDDFEIWGPNYVDPAGPGIIITFTRDDARVEWSS